MALPWYPNRGVNLACLTTGLTKTNPPLPDGFTYLDVKTAHLSCETDDIRLGIFLAILLISVHVLTIIMPLGSILRLVDVSHPATPVRSLGHTCMGMAILSLASFTEVAQHILDNWVYVGTYNSVINSLFHIFLSLSFAVLAWGVNGYSSRIRNALVATTVTTAAVSWATVRISTEVSPTVFGGVGVTTICWAIVYTSLSFNTYTIMKACFDSAQRTKGNQINHLRYGIIFAASNIIGLVSAVLLNGGNQLYHCTTAGSFLIAYLSLALWIIQIMGSTIMYKTK